MGMATFARLVVNTQEAILEFTRWQSNRRDGTPAGLSWIPDAMKMSNPNLIYSQAFFGMGMCKCVSG